MILTTACSKKDKVVDLVFWHGIEVPEYINLLEKKIEEFEKQHPDINIITHFTGLSDNLEETIMLALDKNIGPDLLWWGPQSQGLLASSGKLLVAEDFIEADSSFDIDDILDYLRKRCMSHGKMYSIPFDSNTLGLYYNAELFEKENIDPEEIKTWDDLLEAAKKLTKDKDGDGIIDQYGMQVPAGTSEFTVFAWQTQLWAAGGEFMTEDNKRILFNSDAGIEALQWWVDLINKYKVATPPKIAKGEKLIDDFLSKKVAMCISGPWNYRQLEKEREENKLRYGAILLPQKKRFATNIGGENLYILKTRRGNKNAQWKFAKYILSSEFQLEWSIKTGYLPVLKSVIDHPTYKEYLNNTPFIKTFVEALSYGKNRPTIQAYMRISSHLGKELQLALYQKKSVKAALKTAQEKGDRELSLVSRLLQDNYGDLPRW
jgi:multiple sugar transport system substrate-binding protein